MTGKTNVKTICLLVWILCFSVVLSLRCGSSSNDVDPAAILERIDPNLISIKDIDSALPRLGEEVILLRLRGGQTDFLRRYGTAREDTLRKALIVGASFSAARWEWGFLLRSMEVGHRVDSLKFPIQVNLVTASHELGSMGAPAELCEAIDGLSRNFEKSASGYRDIVSVSRSFERAGKQLRQFIMTRRGTEEAFTFGRQLVWVAELCNLCLKVGLRHQGYLLEAMNKCYKQMKLDGKSHIVELLFAPSERQALGKIALLDSLFPVEMLDQVEQVRSTVFDIFESLDLLFPKIL